MATLLYYCVFQYFLNVNQYTFIFDYIHTGAIFLRTSEFFSFQESLHRL